MIWWSTIETHTFVYVMFVLSWLYSFVFGISIWTPAILQDLVGEIELSLLVRCVETCWRQDLLVEKHFFLPFVCESSHILGIMMARCSRSPLSDELAPNGCGNARRLWDFQHQIHYKKMHWKWLPILKLGSMRSMEVVPSCFIYIHDISISCPYLSPTQPSQRHQGANADGPTRAPLNADNAESSQAAMPTPPREVRWIRARKTQVHPGRIHLPIFPPSASFSKSWKLQMGCLQDSPTIDRVDFHFQDYQRKSQWFEAFGWWILWVFSFELGCK